MKKIFSAFLLMTMMVFSVGSFVSCSDLENEIAKVDTQANANAAAIESLNSEIAALKTALSAAQADADAAMTAAKAAKEAGDAAKAEAEAAKAAAAQAKAEALAAVAEELEAIQTAIAVNVEAITNLGGSVNANAVEIEALQEEVKALQTAAAEAVYAITNLNGSVEKHENAIADLETEVAVLKATIANYEANLKELGLFDEEMKKQIEGITYAITNLDKAVETNTNEIDALKEMLEAVVEQVETLNASLVVIYDILGALANQIQSVVFVPEYDTDVVYAQRYTVGKAKTNYIATATYEVRPAKLAATITSENVSFSSVDVKTKAAAPEYFAAEVISTDANTGRIVVAAIINDKDSKKNDNDYDKLASGKLALSLNIASIDVTELLIAESEPVNVDMVSSEYVNVVANADVNLAVGFKSAKEFKTTYTNDIEMPYNTAVAESVKPLFTEPVMFNVAGLYLTAAEANELLGTSLAVTTAVKAEYAGAEEKKVYPVAVVGKDINATATLVTSPDYKEATDLVGKKATATLTVTVKNDKETVATLNGTATYKISNKKSDIAIASVSEGWKYTYGDKMTVKGRELAVSNYDKFTQGQSLGTFKATWKEGDVEKSATTTVTAMSSKAVKFTDVELPFTAGKATTYTFKNDKVVIGTTTYEVSFDVVLGAMPEDTKIDLGTFTIAGDVANAVKVAVSPVAKAVEYIKNYDNTIAIESAYILNALPNVKGDGVTLNGEAAANAAALYTVTALNEKDNKVREDKSYVEVAKVVEYVNTIVLTKTYEFCGVQFTYTATVNTEKPSIKFAANDVFVKNGVATVDGTVKLPVTKSKTAEVTGTSTPYALSAIDLRNYVHVEMGADVKENGYLLRYTLKTPLVDKDGKKLYADNQVAPAFAQYTAVDVKRETVGLNTLTWGLDLNELDFEIALVSASKADRNEDNKIDATDDVVFGTVDVKLQIPTLVTFAAAETVNAKYVNGVASSANIVEALTIVDKFGNNVYNPYATTLNDIFKGYNATLYNGKVQSVTLASDNFYNVYDMKVTAAELKDVKVYLNNAPIAQSQVKFSYNAETGAIAISEENANLTGDIKFEVPVTLTYVYDNYGKLAQKATAVVVFSQNAEAGEGTEVAFPNPDKLQWAFGPEVYVEMYGADEFEATFGDKKASTVLDLGISSVNYADFGIAANTLFLAVDFEDLYGAEAAGMWIPQGQANYTVVPTDATSGKIVLTTSDWRGNVTEAGAIAYTEFTGTTCKFDLAALVYPGEDKSFVVPATLVESPITVVLQ
jgi:predicted  nucleic acid-binding Zn-ribbon protein